MVHENINKHKTNNQYVEEIGQNSNRELDAILKLMRRPGEGWSAKLPRELQQCWKYCRNCLGSQTNLIHIGYLYSYSLCVIHIGKMEVWFNQIKPSPAKENASKLPKLCEITCYVLMRAYMIFYFFFHNTKRGVFSAPTTRNITKRRASHSEAWSHHALGS